MSDEIAYCINLPENCLGGQNNFTCAEGHIGALCETCDINGIYWQETYSLTGKF